jgi:hypothetical protein
MSDEDACPVVCIFEDGNTCKWQSRNCEKCAEWRLGKADTLSAQPGSPKYDHTLGTKDGGFVYFLSDGTEQMSEKIFQYVSPVFSQSGLTCSISFWYYVFGSFDRLKLFVNSTTGNVIELFDHQPKASQSDWHLVAVKLPVCLKNFQLIIQAMLAFNWIGGIALDDIRLEDCHYKYNTYTTEHFQCSDGNAISTDKVCDFQTDCCDGSDERSKICFKEKTTKCDFEFDYCGWQKLPGDGDVQWLRHNGTTLSTATGPMRDHTFLTDEGHYIYVESSRPSQLNDKARIGQYFDKTTGVCQIRFWYHMYGKDMHTLNIYVRRLISSKLTLVDVVAGNQGNIWHRKTAAFSAGQPFQIILEVVVGNGYNSDVAIDDFSYTKGCTPYIGPFPTPIVPPTTAPSVTKYTSDCHFESDTCNWYEAYQDEFDWHWGNGHSTLAEKYVAPRTDHTRGSPNGYYMYVRDQTIVNTASRDAHLRSPIFQATSSECKVQFFYYLNLTKLTTTTTTKLGLTITFKNPGEEKDKVTLIWQQAKNMGDQWNEAVVGVGRWTVPFVFEFVCYGNGLGRRIIAIDDVTFFDCILGEPTNVCDKQTMFHCPKTKVCLQTHFLCDLTDHCGEGDDEDPNLCEAYARQNFEQDLGAFYQGRDGTDDDFDWTRKNGSTPSFDTGPDTDHTLSTNEGHYIHIESSDPRIEKDKAWLLSRVFKATHKKTGCNMRFYYHMFGEQVDRLAVYVRFYRSGPAARLLWEERGDKGNFWAREEIVLDEKKDFQVRMCI